MRTRITIDDKIAYNLKELKKKNLNKSFKEIVNQTLARGLAISSDAVTSNFIIEPLEAIPHKHLSFDNINKLLKVAEGDLHQ